MATLLAHNHQIVEDEQCPSVSLSEVWTSTQVNDFIDVELQNKMALGGGEFLQGGRGTEGGEGGRKRGGEEGGRERERGRGRKREGEGEGERERERVRVSE